MLGEVQKSLILATFFRGSRGSVWHSSSDQVITLSLFYSGDISADDCIDRFSNKPYLKKLYKSDPYELTEEIWSRYQSLINLIREHSELIEGGGDLELPADPTFTGCRLTNAGVVLARSLVHEFPRKPEFPNWPDKRPHPK